MALSRFESSPKLAATPTLRRKRQRETGAGPIGSAEGDVRNDTRVLHRLATSSWTSIAPGATPGMLAELAPSRYRSRSDMGSRARGSRSCLEPTGFEQRSESVVGQVADLSAEPRSAEAREAGCRSLSQPVGSAGTVEAGVRRRGALPLVALPIPGEPIHRDRLHRFAAGLRPIGEPGPGRPLGAIFNRVQRPPPDGAGKDRGRGDGHRHVLSLRRCAAHVLIAHWSRDALESGQVVDEHWLAVSRNGIRSPCPGDSSPRPSAHLGNSSSPADLSSLAIGHEGSPGTPGHAAGATPHVEGQPSCR